MRAAAPTARPKITRKRTRTPTFGAKAAPMAPTEKVTAAMRMRLRLPRGCLADHVASQTISEAMSTIAR